MEEEIIEITKPPKKDSSTAVRAQKLTKENIKNFAKQLAKLGPLKRILIFYNHNPEMFKEVFWQKYYKPDFSAR